MTASDSYVDLLDRHDGGEVRLVARADHLREVDDDVRATLLRPIVGLHVVAQWARTAKRIDTGGDVDLARTLTVLHRERIRTVATFDPRLGSLDLELLPGRVYCNPA